MEKQFISIKQACNDFNKSLSTIRRIVKESPTNEIKREKLKTGHEKIYISNEYLKEYFNNSKESIHNNNSEGSHSNNSVNSSNEQLTKSLEETIQILKNELDAKNKQIESFLQRQYESNVIIERLQQKEQNLLESLEVKKKRKWWQKKKGV